MLAALFLWLADSIASTTASMLVVVLDVRGMELYRYCRGFGNIEKPTVVYIP